MTPTQFAPGKRLRPRLVLLAIALLQCGSGVAPAQNVGLRVLQNFGSVLGTSPEGGLIQATDGNFYGVATANSGRGTVFRMTPAGDVTLVHRFSNTADGLNADGAGPSGRLIQGVDGAFYGTTSFGGSGGQGTVYRVTADGAFSVLHNFSLLNTSSHNSDGADPVAGVIQAQSGAFYGTAQAGGTNGRGTIFKITAAGVFSVVHTFTALSSGTNGDGANSAAPLFQSTDGLIYGTTPYGGTAGKGVLFAFNEAGNFGITGNFSTGNNDGANPFSGVALSQAGNLYGTTYGGGTSQLGTIFRYTPSTGAFITYVSFNGTNGSHPYGGILVDSENSFIGTTSSGGTAGLGVIYRVTGLAIVSTLHSLSGPTTDQIYADGYFPDTTLCQGTDGNLYGVVSSGGMYNGGLAFRQGRTAPTDFVPLYNFKTETSEPTGTLAVDAAGNLYGTTEFGGKGYGTVFQVTPAGTRTILHEFSRDDGTNPLAGVVLANDGFLYGCATNSGSGAPAVGTVFRLATDGSAFTVLKQFHGPDGNAPTGRLVQGSDGNLYGTTEFGGANGTASVFQLTPAGGFTLLHSLAASVNGTYPEGTDLYAGLTEGSPGIFYGTTQFGGTADRGTAFQITAGGLFRKLTDFTGPNGRQSASGLVLGSDGNLHGATLLGGANDAGSIFLLTPSGALTTSYSFTLDGSNGYAANTNYDGNNPIGALCEGPDGNLYGVTTAGGAAFGLNEGVGTIFQLTPGGALTTLVNFNLSDGYEGSGLIFANNRFYGVAQSGGILGGGTLFQLVLPPLITSASAVGGQVGSAFSYQIGTRFAASGFTATGLPSGLTLDASTGVISGTPSVAGVSNATLGATNDAGTAPAFTLTLTVVLAPPVVTSALTVDAQLNVAFNYQLAADSSPTSFAAVGLPDGLVLDSGTGRISGAATAAGVFAVAVSASNSTGAGPAATLTLTVSAPVVTVTAAVPSVEVGGTFAAFGLNLSFKQPKNVFVEYQVKGTAENGVDYVLLKGRKKIKAGKTAAKIRVVPISDLGGAAKKAVKLILLPGDGYTVGDTVKAKVKILGAP